MNIDVSSQVKIMLGDENVNIDVIDLYCEHAYEKACEITKYDKLPKKLENNIVDAVVECLNRKGHEGFSSRTELSTSTTYSFKDLDESLKAKLRGKTNPLSLIGSNRMFI